jgi:CHAT domain-containing protein
VRPGEALIEYVRYQPYDHAADTWGSRRYGAFVLLGDGGEAAAADLGEAEAIDRAVQRLQEAMRSAIDQFKSLLPSRGQLRRSEAKIAEASAALRALAWQPLEKHLADVERVYVAPDGRLSLIPFEVLAQEKEAGGWRYLAEDRELVYLSTARDLARLALSGAAGEERPQTAVLVNNPAFDAAPRELAGVLAELSPSDPMLASSGSRAGVKTLGASVTGGARRSEIPREWNQYDELDRLTRQAGEQLERLGWSVTALSDRAAVEEAVLRLRAPRILQFATHGYILDRPEKDQEGWDNPLLRSMLILAGANRWRPEEAVFYQAGEELLSEAEARERGWTQEQLDAARVQVGDGILTAYEATGMNLRGTELVNLTACETGLGEVTPDGVVGLRQAFLLAGARALTMSMWEVPAYETTEQIMNFYERWLSGGEETTRYGAFRAAQLEALRKARKTHGVGHPFYWAGVVYAGDPGDLPQLALESTN